MISKWLVSLRSLEYSLPYLPPALSLSVIPQNFQPDSPKRSPIIAYQALAFAEVAEIR